MLAQFALIAFAWLALLSLAIDIGFARLTQGQMQTAADAAALEGLRHRDVGVTSPGTGQIATAPFASDCIRRTAAHRVVRQVFDDDLDAAFEDPAYAFGAGPVIDLTEGVTSLHALQTISVPDSRVYEPYLQLNQQNAVDGDMVSGRFCYSVDPARSEHAGYGLPGTIVCTEPQRGFGRYARNDFNPSASPPQPPSDLARCPAPDEPPPNPWPQGGSGSLTTADDSAFLVRLRRSNELRDLPGQTEPDVASSGPSLPFLFGRGSTMHGDDPASDYSPRRDGLTVRATAIAEMRPAMRVGVPVPQANLPGVTPFAVADTCVQAANGAAVTLTVTINPATGVMTRTGAGTPTCATGSVVGRFVANRTAISTVGGALPVMPAPIACTPAVTSLTGQYGPVYSLITSGGPRIIGFARVNFTAVCPALPTAAFTATIVRATSLVAASNATAALSGGLTIPPGTTPAAIRELLDKHFERNGAVAYGPLLVPVLAR